jgi:predicted metal-dependent peptidase
VLENLPPMTLFAPSTIKFGEVKPFGLGGGNGLFLYLSPQLEKKSQKEVDFTVAHEFAHIALGHYKPEHRQSGKWHSHEDAPDEHDADRLVESWGFRLPKSERGKS